MSAFSIPGQIHNMSQMSQRIKDDLERLRERLLACGFEEEAETVLQARVLVWGVSEMLQDASKKRRPVGWCRGD